MATFSWFQFNVKCNSFFNSQNYGVFHLTKIPCELALMEYGHIVILANIHDMEMLFSESLELYTNAYV